MPHSFKNLVQGTLTEREGSVPLTSSRRELVLYLPSRLSPPLFESGFTEVRLGYGNANLRVRLRTTDFVKKVACFVKKVSNIFDI